ncbi:MAG: hypothetical protein KAU14_03725, partial [Thermoplasmata archaeon]|nr:hypothetical protein [Thermoplasmata archaeon]
IRAAENVSDSLIGSIVEGLDQSVVLPGITESLISDVKVKVLSVSISPLALKVQVEVTLNNPTTFTIEVSELNYDVHYDDNDVSGIPFVASYPAKYNIYLDTVNEKLDPRLVLEAGSSTKKEATIHSNSLEHCVRLNDEYNVDDDLMAHIYGDMLIHIGDFKLRVDLTVKDIRVPRG